MNLTALLKESFGIVRKNLLIALPLLAVSVLMLLLSLIFTGSMYPFEHTYMMGKISPEAAAAGETGLSFFGTFVLMFLGSVLVLLAGGMTTAMVDLSLKEEKGGLKAGWNRTIGRIIPLLIASVLVGLLTGVGFILLVIPGIIIAFLVMFALPAVMIDESGGFESIAVSTRTVVRNLRTTVILFLILIALGVLFGIVTTIIGLIPIAGPIIDAVISALYGAFMTAFIVLAYEGLKANPENPPEVEV